MYNPNIVGGGFPNTPGYNGYGGWSGGPQAYQSYGNGQTYYGHNGAPPSQPYQTYPSRSPMQPYYQQTNIPQSGYTPQSYGGATKMWSNPSIRPVSNFNPNIDAEVLRKAMKGFGCNKSKVINALCTRSNWQRQDIARAFKVMYGKDLAHELKSELHGDFEHLILALMEPPACYDAMQLHKAMAGLGTKESVLIEVMTTRTNAQIQEIKMAYRHLYGRELEHDLIGDTSGHFKRLLVSLCVGGRDESNHTDPIGANQDARSLYHAGEQRLGTDESRFNAILVSRNMFQLRMIFDEYQKITGHGIEKAIENEFSGDIKDGLLAIVKSIRYRPAYFAELLHKSMKGFGTRDNDLIRLIVTRSEIDLRDIKQSYHQLYKNSLENAISGDCSGAYKEGLLALVKGNY
ncbi:hypothetical protein FO519_002233 [Halicephalobus sp. NKZ332]|nr:hypothetical protein FO519_002233 [Halicephalobus sp. NKZ332]